MFVKEQKGPYLSSSLTQLISSLAAVRVPPATQNKQKAPAFQFPSKLISPPTNNKKQTSHLITPLLVHSHSYPQNVLKHITNSKVQKDSSNRGIGVFKQINWFFHGKSIILWMNDRDKQVQIQLEEAVNCIAIGQLKEKCLPSKLKSHYLIALGFQNTVSLYSLNPYTLEFQRMDYKYQYKIRHALEIQQIKFVTDNIILIATSSGVVQLFEFCQNQVKRKTIQFPFYRNFVPVSLSKSKKTILQLLYTPKRIFVLLTESFPKTWIKNQIDHFIANKPYEQYEIVKQIVVFEIQPTKLVEVKKITQFQVLKKLKSIMPNWGTSTQIASIYLDKKQDIEGQLGIVTTDGWFLVFKNGQSNFLSKEPLLFPTTQQLGACSYLEEKKLGSYNIEQQLKNKQSNLVKASLGYQNLTLISNGLFWLGDDRIDGVLTSQLNAEVFAKSEQRTVNSLQQTKQWQVFSLKNYYTVKQLPLREFVAYLFYLKGIVNNNYEGQHYNQAQFKSFFQKQIKKMKPQKFLKCLIEIVFLQVKTISVNKFVQDLVSSQIRDETIKNFKDWNHILSGVVQKQQLFLTQKMILQVWSLIIQLQHAQVPSSDVEDKSYCSTNAYWLAMHSIFYSTISQLLDWNHQQFKDHRKQVQEAQSILRRLDKFIESKKYYEGLIQNNSQYKSGKLGQNITQTSTIMIKELQLMTQQAKHAVITRSFDKKFEDLSLKLKKSITSTTILISIYFNLEGYLELNQQKRLNLGINCFKDILISKDCQKRLKKLVITNSKFIDLQDLKLKLPVFAIEEDLPYLQCKNKILTQNLPKNQINLVQLGKAINSDYFEDVNQIFGNRMDLKIKMLDSYYEKLQVQEGQVAGQLARYYKHQSRKQSFPEELEQAIKDKKAYLQNEIYQILAEQKRSIKYALQIQNQHTKAKDYTYTNIIKDLIIAVSGSKFLLDHMEAEAKQLKLIKQIQIIKQTKNRIHSGSKALINAPFHRQSVPQELFPRQGGW